eukprot:TRINITY_DN11493_c0_g2_i3.p1 TRINITY_DN11493_c0_g2~~TRINITY_DN11493_c0_g2_i3.p1  ORF type:complete len:193 (-),score=-7.99 TRINITY_DN11493_c0_g2_i3:6-584(-)
MNEQLHARQQQNQVCKCIFSDKTTFQKQNQVCKCIFSDKMTFQKQIVSIALFQFQKFQIYIKKILTPNQFIIYYFLIILQQYQQMHPNKTILSEYFTKNRDGAVYKKVQTCKHTYILLFSTLGTLLFNVMVLFFEVWETNKKIKQEIEMSKLVQITGNIIELERTNIKIQQNNKQISKNCDLIHQKQNRYQN